MHHPPSTESRLPCLTERILPDCVARARGDKTTGDIVAPEMSPRYVAVSNQATENRCRPLRHVDCDNQLRSAPNESRWMRLEPRIYGRANSLVKFFCRTCLSVGIHQYLYLLRVQTSKFFTECTCWKAGTPAFENFSERDFPIFTALRSVATGGWWKRQQSERALNLLTYRL